MKIKMKMHIRYGKGTAYILSAIFYILNAPAFAAPFASWIDVKAECGAVGDGVADDTAAIQKGLDLMRPEDSQRKILYLPAGQYRITGTIKALREKHRECQGVGVQGEGAEKSVILYDGNGGEPMLQWGAWYSTVRGLGFQPKKVEGERREVEGQQNAENTPSAISQPPTAGIWFGPEFSTGNEVSDCAFLGLPIGIQGGTDKTKGQAEVCVRRCYWNQCGKGILLQNWNSLDWWVWDSVFEGCDQAISNDPGCGAYNAYRNLFINSKSTDLKIDNLGGFGFVENISKGSGMFLSSNCHTAGANLVLQGNHVYRDGWDKERRDSALIYIGHPGPVLLLDNVLQRAKDASGPEIYVGPGNHMNPSGSALLMGNTSTATNGSLVKIGLFDVRLLDEGESAEGLKSALMPVEGEDRKARLEPKLSFPGQVVEVEPGANAEELQRVIDGAADGSVVHLTPGKYAIDRPIRIPGGKQVTLRGDGLLNATTIAKGGDFQGDALVVCENAGGVVLQDLAIGNEADAGGPAGLLIKTKDQPGIAVKGDQVQSYGFGPGLVVQGLDEARVVLENHGHNGVTVFGGPNSKGGKRGGATVEILQGASSRSAGLRPNTPIYDVRGGGRMLVRDIWYEGDPREYLHLQDAGDFVQCGHKIAPNKEAGHTGVESIKLAGKRGQVLMTQSALCGADLVIGKLDPGFRVTLFGLTPNPGTRISYGDPSSGRADIEDGISGADQSKADSNTVSNIESPISDPTGFVQLMCRNNNQKLTGSVALPDVNPDQDIQGRFQILRDWKLPDPDLPARVRLHRVRCEGGVGMVVVSSQPKAKGKE